MIKDFFGSHLPPCFVILWLNAKNVKTRLFCVIENNWRTKFRLWKNMVGDKWVFFILIVMLSLVKFWYVVCYLTKNIGWWCKFEFFSALRKICCFKCAGIIFTSEAIVQKWVKFGKWLKSCFRRKVFCLSYQLIFWQYPIFRSNLQFFLFFNFMKWTVFKFNGSRKLCW